MNCWGCPPLLPTRSTNYHEKTNLKRCFEERLAWNAVERHLLTIFYNMPTQIKKGVQGEASRMAQEAKKNQFLSGTSSLRRWHVDFLTSSKAKPMFIWWSVPLLGVSRLTLLIFFCIWLHGEPIKGDLPLTCNLCFHCGEIPRPLGCSWRYHMQVWSLFEEIFRAAIIICKAVAVSCHFLSYAGNIAAVLGFIFGIEKSEKRLYKLFSRP